MAVMILLKTDQGNPASGPPVWAWVAFGAALGYTLTFIFLE